MKIALLIGLLALGSVRCFLVPDDFADEASFVVTDMPGDDVTDEASTTSSAPVTPAQASSTPPVQQASTTPQQEASSTPAITPTPPQQASTPGSSSYVTVTVTATVTKTAGNPERDYVDVSKAIHFEPVNKYVTASNTRYTYYDLEDYDGQDGSYLYTTNLRMYPGESTMISLETVYKALYTHEKYFRDRTIERYAQFTANIEVVDNHNKRECYPNADYPDTHCDNSDEVCTPDTHNDRKYHCQKATSCYYSSQCPQG